MAKKKGAHSENNGGQLRYGGSAKVESCTDLGFGADTVHAINPDVLGQNVALLVEFQVLLKLCPVASSEYRLSRAGESYGDRLTFSVLETIFDSACEEVR